MAPHAVSPPRSQGHSVSTSKAHSPGRHDELRCVLPETNKDELHDLICVGFGPASLAIAVALHDSVEFGQTAFNGRDRALPKVAFLEQQRQFAWHPGMQIPGARMQISWIKDFATMRSPRSQFTFLNYLHSVGRLVQFSNLGTFTPLRIEYEAYMRWCAGWFQHLTAYGQEGLEIVPQTLTKHQPGSAPKVDHFLVRSRNLATGEVEERRSKHVVVGTGGRGKIPDSLPQSHPRVIHSSQYMSKIEDILKDREGSYRAIVLGAGQSAAEVFHDLQSRYPNSQTRLMIRGSALKPSDDSPFVNETFDPDRVDAVFRKSAEIRAADINDEKVTNYGVVRINLLEEIYNDLYEHKVRHPEVPDDERPHQILPFREVVGVDNLDKGHLQVQVENRSGEHGMDAEQAVSHDIHEADVVIVAAGYQRNLHEHLLKNARGYLPGGDSPGKKWTVGRDYRVDFEKDVVKEDAGVWLQGCNQQTHGLSDTLLSILSIRGGEMVDSIFGRA